VLDNTEEDRKNRQHFELLYQAAEWLTL